MNVPATGAPTNGATSKGTAPASGVSTPTPTPKGGEGAVANMPAPGQQSETPAKPAFNPIRTKLKFGDGAEEEVEVGDEETLQRRLIAAKGFDKAQKQYLAEQKARQADAEKLKALGFDPNNPDAYFQKRLEEEARRHGMTEEQRAIDDAKREAATVKARALATQKQLQAQLAELQDQRAWQELEPRLQSAMTQHGMIGDTHAMESIERVAQEFINAGLDVPPEQVVAEAAARDKERFSNRLVALPSEAIWKQLPEAKRKELMAIGVAEWKAARGVQTSTPAPAQPKPQGPKEYLTPYEYLAKRRGG
jgi:hypothetical protein